MGVTKKQHKFGSATEESVLPPKTNDKNCIGTMNFISVLKKYAHVYSWTRDLTAGVKSIFCAPAGRVKGNVLLTLLPELATPVPFPFPLALDLIILIRP
jgi:hypothetical protein